MTENRLSQIAIPVHYRLGTLTALIAACYCLQMLSPLRLNTDSTRLLSMAASAHAGEGYLVDGNIDQFPNGYPAVVRVMLRAGIANSSSLVALISDALPPD